MFAELVSQARKDVLVGGFCGSYNVTSASSLWRFRRARVRVEPITYGLNGCTWHRASGVCVIEGCRC